MLVVGQCDDNAIKAFGRKRLVDRVDETRNSKRVGEITTVGRVGPVDYGHGRCLGGAQAGKVAPAHDHATT